MKQLTTHIQDDISWCVLFADDIVLADKTARGVKTKLEIWREALKSKGFIKNTKLSICSVSLV